MRSAEEIKMITTAWSNILKGNNVSDQIKEISKIRMDICKDCPLLTYSTTTKVFETLANGVKIFLGKEVSEVTGLTCKICGCGYAAIAVTPEKECPYYENTQGVYEPASWPEEVMNGISNKRFIPKPKWNKVQTIELK